MSGKHKTLFEKVWESHLVAEPAGEPSLLYIDLHLLHEVTSPQAFEGLRLAGRAVRRPDRCAPLVMSLERLLILLSPIEACSAIRRHARILPEGP